jgi:hypothetical protein
MSIPPVLGPLNPWMRIAVVALVTWWGATTGVRADDADFFREKIQPLLEERCYDCHSHASGKMKGGLTLDSRSGWSEGGGSGPALVPGKPEESLLIKAVRRLDDDMAMPPKKALPEAEVVLLTEWVKRGAPDPRLSKQSVKPSGDWWSLKPLPTADASRAVLGEAPSIDGFVRRKLAEKGMAMSPETDRRTLMRRIYFDLHGLAPTMEEVTTFVSDPDPRAYEKLVDRLLESPRYGERWARHWLDTIHFADTHGFEHDMIRANAWRYRDYVVGALNADTSWPRFIREQIAADALFPDQPRLTAALGFLGAGPYDASAAGTAPLMFEAVDRDDMLVQTMAAFTSTTAGCARCHDHKFDPISQRDYYALAAVFAGITKGDIPYDDDPQTTKARLHWQSLAAAAKGGDAAKLSGEDAKRIVEQWERERGPVAQWEITSPREFVSAGGAALTLNEDGSVTSGGKRPEIETLTFSLDPKLRNVQAVRLEVLADPALPKSGPGRQDNGNLHLSECEIFVVEGTAEPKRIAIARASADFNQQDWTIAHAIDGNEKTAWGIFPHVGESHRAVFELGEPVTLAEGAVLRVILKQVHGGGHIIGRARLSVTDAPAAGREILPAEVALAVATPAAERSEAARKAVAAHAVAEVSAKELAKLPPPALVFAAAKDVTRDDKKISMAEPRVIRLLKRGDLASPTEVVEAGALGCVTSMPSRFTLTDPKQEASRRVALAEWIANQGNPLTWRSVVNRMWHYHFGRGLVDTPNDLGRMGSLPSHPELLDWLAADFRDHGGSLKRLHRQIVTCAAYRQTSALDPAGKQVAADGENRLLWRANRQRIDAESYRDIVLQVAGRLDLTMGGPAVMHFKLGPPVQSTPTLDYAAFQWDQPGANRRSIYRFVFRNIVDPFMTALDFPDAAQLAPTRPFSASALQALVLWNDAFVLHQSERLAERVEKMSPDSVSRVESAIRLVFLRESTAEEQREFGAYAEKYGLAALCRVLFNSNEFLFVN